MHEQEGSERVGIRNKKLGQNIGFLQTHRTNELEECFLT